MSTNQHSCVREVLDHAKTSAEAARHQHNAGMLGMPIKDDFRSVRATHKQQTVTLEELDRPSYMQAGTQPVVVLRFPDGAERYFQFDEDGDAWREVTWNDILRADSDADVKTEAEHEDEVFADYEDPVLAWQKALQDLLAELRP